MFKKGDTIIYGTQGVCRVLNVGKLDIGIANDKEYYTLKPLYHNDSLFYVPVDSTKSVIRKAMTKSEAETLIAKIPTMGIAWVPNEKEREAQYKAALHTCDCGELIKIIKLLYERKKNRIKDGKKFTAVDEKYFRMAEQQLYGEIAFALSIDRDSVEDYITEKID